MCQRPSFSVIPSCHGWFLGLQRNKIATSHCEQRLWTELILCHVFYAGFRCSKKQHDRVGCSLAHEIGRAHV